MKRILTRADVVWIYRTDVARAETTDVEIEKFEGDTSVEHGVLPAPEAREHYKARRREGFQ